MRKLLTLLFISFLVVITTEIYSQRFLGSVAAGVNFSRLDGDEADSGFGYNKIGANLGVAVILPFGKNNQWDITLETSFSQKGARKKKYSEHTYTWPYDLRLNYVEVPLIFHYNDKNKIKFGLGVSWGRLVSFKEVEDDGYIEPYSDTHPFDDNDISGLLELMVRVWKNVHVNVRYSHSIVPIRERLFTHPPTNPPDPDLPNITGTETREQRNNVITLRVVYTINEKLDN